MIKKLSISLLLLIVFSGCSVDYNLDISKDLIIDETININEKTIEINKYALDKEFFIDSLIDDYKQIYNYSTYMFEKNINNSESIVIAKKHYLGIEDYKNNNEVYRMVFEDYTISNQGDVYTFAYKINNKNEISLFKEDELYDSLVDDINFNITLPFKVLEENSDSMDEKQSKYTWKINKEQELKDIVIVFDISKEPLKKETIGLYAIVGLFVLLVVIVIFGFYKYKRFNKI